MSAKFPVNAVKKDWVQWLRPHMEHLLSSFDFGTKKVELIAQNSSCPDSLQQWRILCDRFTIRLPYAEHWVTVECLCHYCYPEICPDFICNSDFAKFYPDLSLRESGEKWDYKNPLCLKAIMLDILILFKDFQLNKFKQYDRLQLEIDCIQHAHSTNYKEHWDFILFDEETPDYFAGDALFVAELNIDQLNELPDVIWKKDDADQSCDMVVFRVVLPQFGTGKPHVDLVYSPQFGRLLGLGNHKLPLPPYLQNETRVQEYFHLLQDWLNSKVSDIGDQFKRRQEVAVALVQVLASDVLEYDTELFKTVSFGCELHGFRCHVTVILSRLFTYNEVPVTMASYYHESRSFQKPYDITNILRGVSKDAAPKKVADYIVKSVKDKLPGFQKDSVSFGR